MTSVDEDPILDFAYLERQTFSDRELERELLTLFAAQCERLAPVIKDAPEADRRDAAHTLTGAARAVGATRIAVLTARIEAEPGDGSQSLVASLDRAVDEAIQTIVRHLG